jgi:hypothetical protein
MDTTEKAVATSEGVVPNKLWWAEPLHISHNEKLSPAGLAHSDSRTSVLRQEQSIPPTGKIARGGLFHGPAPKKADAVPQQPIMLFGDSMADWLAYGPSRPSVTPGNRHPFNLVRLPRNPSGKMFFGGCSERSGALRPAPRATSAAKVTQSEL